MNTTTNMSRVAARLRTTKTQLDLGREEGREWAEELAEAHELEYLAGWAWEEEIDRSGRLTAEDAARNLFEIEWGYPLDSLMVNRVTERRLQGFIEGALDVWSEAQLLLTSVPSKGAADVHLAA